MSKQSSVSLILVLSLSVILGFGFQLWTKPPQPTSVSEMRSLALHPTSKATLLAANARQIFAKHHDEGWKLLWNIDSGKPIEQILTFKSHSDSVFILTSKRLYQGLLGSSQSDLLFTLSEKNHNILCMIIFEWSPQRWWLGTSRGIYETRDDGKSWSKLTSFSNEVISLLYAFNHQIYVGAGYQLYRGSPDSDFETVFALPYRILKQEADHPKTDSSPEKNASVDLRTFYDLNALVFTPTPQPTFWLATSNGVYRSFDGKTAWHRLSDEGLRNIHISHILYSRASNQLFAASNSGVYRFRSGHHSWHELYQGLESTLVFDISLMQDSSDTLAAVTGAGLALFAIQTEVPVSGPTPLPSEETLLLFKKLIALEPSARELHKAILQYNDVHPKKIKRWHSQSRLKSLIPSFSFGRDVATGNNIDIDRGSTSKPDRYIIGPDDHDEGWDMDISWDLGELIWSSSQTSIDSRSKLNVELRQELLSEATRIFYERRRLQTELIFQRAPSENEHIQKLIRMEELTSLLDALSDGLFNKRLRKIYKKDPNLRNLWLCCGTAHKTNSLNLYPLPR